MFLTKVRKIVTIVVLFYGCLLAIFHKTIVREILCLANLVSFLSKKEIKFCLQT
jgi:hypothetical protein